MQKTSRYFHVQAWTLPGFSAAGDSIAPDSLGPLTGRMEEFAELRMELRSCFICLEHEDRTKSAREGRNFQ